MTLPDAITNALPPDNELRIAQVASTTPLEVSIEGSPVPTGRLASYPPVTGDTVAVLRQDATWLTLGKVLGDGQFGASPFQLLGPAQLSGNTNLNTAAVTLAGTTINFTTYAPNQMIMAWWTADIESIGTTATAGVVRLLVDGVAVAQPGAVLNQSNVAIGLRATVASSTPVVIPAAGAHTVALQGLRGAGADNMLRADALNTALSILVLG